MCHKSVTEVLYSLNRLRLVTEVPQRYHITVTVMSQPCTCNVTVLSQVQNCYKKVVTLSQFCQTVVSEYLDGIECVRIVTEVSQYFHTFVTKNVTLIRSSPNCHSDFTLLPGCSYRVSILMGLSQRCHSTVTLLSQNCHSHAKQL